MPHHVKIVILDGHTNNPGDLSWAPLEALGDLVVHPRTSREQVVQQAGGATAMLVNKVAVGDDAMAQLPELRYIGVMATGYNIVETDAAKRRGITVTNIPAYSTESTAQHAFALLLALTNHVGSLTSDIDERWPASPDFSYWDEPLIELAGLTCGIIGFGAIGKAFARRARAFGMKVVAHTRPPEKHEKAAGELGVSMVSLDEVLRQSDVLSLHCPLTPETRGLIDANAIAKMKPTALLINASRGPILDEPAVAAALNEDRLGGAGIDVLSEEPPRNGNPLLTARNCILTPHVAWASTAARKRLIDIAAANLRGFLEGNPTNVVNG